MTEIAELADNLIKIGGLTFDKQEKHGSLSWLNTIFLVRGHFENNSQNNWPRQQSSLKKKISQTDYYLVNLSSKTNVFEDKLTKY